MFQMRILPRHHKRRTRILPRVSGLQESQNGTILRARTNYNCLGFVGRRHSVFKTFDGHDIYLSELRSMQGDMSRKNRRLQHNKVLERGSVPEKIATTKNTPTSNSPKKTAQPLQRRETQINVGRRPEAPQEGRNSLFCRLQCLIQLPQNSESMHQDSAGSWEKRNLPGRKRMVLRSSSILERQQ